MEEKNRKKDCVVRVHVGYQDVDNPRLAEVMKAIGVKKGVFVTELTRQNVRYDEDIKQAEHFTMDEAVMAKHVLEDMVDASISVYIDQVGDPYVTQPEHDVDNQSSEIIT